MINKRSLNLATSVGILLAEQIRQTKKSNGKTVELINTSDLKSGIYFMSIIIDGNAITKEFLIN